MQSLFVIIIFSFLLYFVASKESSFVYALSSAILTHTIAEACTFKRMTCTIESRDEMSMRTLGFIDNDVPDNVLFAMDISRQFFDDVETKRKSLSDREILNLHNNKIGRQVCLLLNISNYIRVLYY